jgi:hypothetical protein
MKLSVEVYEAWHSLWTQFGKSVVVHCAFVVHAVDWPMPSGSGSGWPSGFSTSPHTGQEPTPEQSRSLQSATKSQSLSLLSLQAAGVFSGAGTQTSGASISTFGASTTTPSPGRSRGPGPHATTASIARKKDPYSARMYANYPVTRASQARENLGSVRSSAFESPARAPAIAA